MKLLGMGILLLFSTLTVLGHEEVDTDDSTQKPWERNITFGITHQQGLENETLWTGSITADRRSDHYSFLSSLIWKYDDKTETDRLDKTKILGMLEGRHQPSLEQHVFYAMIGDAFHDSERNIRLGYDLGPAVGYYFLESEKFLLDASIGATYSYEDTPVESSFFPSLRVAENFKWIISESHVFWFDTIYYDRMNDWGRRRVSLNTGISSKFSEQWSFRVELRDDYEPRPTDPNAIKNDMILIVGLGYDF